MLVYTISHMEKLPVFETEPLIDALELGREFSEVLATKGEVLESVLQTLRAEGGEFSSGAELEEMFSESFFVRFLPVEGGNPDDNDEELEQWKLFQLKNLARMKEHLLEAGEEDATAAAYVLVDYLMNI